MSDHQDLTDHDLPDHEMPDQHTPDQDMVVDDGSSAGFGDRVKEPERLRRWRLVLGGEGGRGQAALGSLPGGEGFSLEQLAALSKEDLQRDGALDALYSGERSGGLGASSPRVARWLGDIRTYFPASVVKVLQRDALDVQS